MNAHAIALNQLDVVDTTELRRGDVLVDPVFVPYDGIGVVVAIERGIAWKLTLRCLDGDNIVETTTTSAHGIFIGRLPETIDPDDDALRAAVKAAT